MDAKLEEQWPEEERASLCARLDASVGMNTQELMWFAIFVLAALGNRQHLPVTNWFLKRKHVAAALNQHEVGLKGLCVC